MLPIAGMNALQFVASGCRKIFRSRVRVRTSFRYVAAIGALSFSFVCSQANGYVLEGPSWPTGTVVVFQLNLGNPPTPLQDGSTSWNDAVAPALDSWNQNILRIQTTSIRDTPIPATSGDRINTVVFSSTVFGQSFGKSTLAVTYYRTLGSNFTEADILFNSAQSFNSYRGRLQFASNGTVIADIQRVFLHESGHAIGLGHPDQAGQSGDPVMNSVTSNRYVLAQDDINGAQFLYGASVVAPPPPPPPTPTATVTATPTATPTGTPPPAPTPPSGSGPLSHLANISTRMNVGIGENVMIAGFIVSGSANKQVLLRAIGPSLASVGLTGTLQNPYLELHDSSGATIAFNDDWQTGGQRDDIIATGAPPQDDRESALIATVAPGSYTALLRGMNDTTGISIVEAYELDSADSRLVNISTRGRVGVDQNVMIAGFIVRGDNQKKLYVRALGPSLNSNSVKGGLADPTLELYNSDGALLAANDDWMNSPQYAEIVATTIPPPDGRESAIVASLPPGNATAIMRGANFTQGVGLVEVYDLDR